MIASSFLVGLKFSWGLLFLAYDAIMDQSRGLNVNKSLFTLALLLNACKKPTAINQTGFIIGVNDIHTMEKKGEISEFDPKMFDHTV